MRSTFIMERGIFAGNEWHDEGERRIPIYKVGDKVWYADKRSRTVDTDPYTVEKVLQYSDPREGKRHYILDAYYLTREDEFILASADPLYPSFSEASWPFHPRIYERGKSVTSHVRGDKVWRVIEDGNGNWTVDPDPFTVREVKWYSFDGKTIALGYYMTRGDETVFTRGNTWYHSMEEALKCTKQVDTLAELLQYSAANTDADWFNGGMNQ